MTTEALRLLTRWLKRRVSPDAFARLGEALAGSCGSIGERGLDNAFVAARRIGDARLQLDATDLAHAKAIRPSLDPCDWTLDETARIALVLAAGGDGPAFANRVRRLARSADVREMVALLKGLPLYPSTQELVDFAREGVRSGITPVFDAVSQRNPYPAEAFDDASWNQMVLKALFMERPLRSILGLEQRSNQALAGMLVDLAHERWSAGRPVPHELWRCVGLKPNDKGLEALRRAAKGSNPDGRRAAIEALRACGDPNAAVILASMTDRVS